MIGTTLSHYCITEKLGAGGMGEVYRAEDTNLDRQVAIKVLPDIFSGDPERLARFEREAKLLALLNHPNIAAIHGLEEAGGKRFLVLELVEGETLAQRIAKGPLPVDEALDVCRQIAEGLEAAHEKGVLHRDLKPANVMITPEGGVWTATRSARWWVCPPAAPICPGCGTCPTSAGNGWTEMGLPGGRGYLISISIPEGKGKEAAVQTVGRG